jgi:hypothetical protein
MYVVYEKPTNNPLLPGAIPPSTAKKQPNTSFSFPESVT